MHKFARLALLSVLVCYSTPGRVHAQSAAPEAARASEPRAVAHTSITPAPTSQTYFPGSSWINSGYVSPLEPGNLLTTYAFEQGLTLAKRGPHSVVPYAALTMTTDQEGLDWNNKAVSQVGLRYSRAFRNGVVQAGAGYAYERRFRSNFAAGQPIGFASYWFGWNRALGSGSSRKLWSSLPGTSWATVGNHAPAERNNVIASVYVQQGITLATFAKVSVIPFVEHTVTLDSAGHSWNNRRTHGEGLKLRVPVGSGVLDTAAIYKHERRWRDGQSANGLTASVSLWYGWNPSKIHKEK